MIRNVWWFLKILATGFIKYRQLIPKTFVFGFTILSGIYIAFTQGAGKGITYLAQTVLAAELVIRNNVDLAIAADPTYTAFAFAQIINSLVLLYFITKFLYKLIHGWTGSQAPYGTIAITILVLAIIEVSAVAYLEKEFFFPVKDGVWYLLMNLQPVFGNINWFSFTAPAQPAAEQLTQQVNSTNLVNESLQN